MPAKGNPIEWRQRVAIGQNHRAAGIAGQALHRLRTGRAMGPRVSGRFHIHCFSGCFPVIGRAAGSIFGNRLAWFPRHTPRNITWFELHRTKVSWTQNPRCGYRFDNGGVTAVSHGLVRFPFLGRGRNQLLSGLLTVKTWLRLGAVAVVLSLPGASWPGSGGSAHAGDTLEQRKLPMRFAWHESAGCDGQLVAAVGTITSDTPKDFADFAEGVT